MTVHSSTRLSLGDALGEIIFFSLVWFAAFLVMLVGQNIWFSLATHLFLTLAERRYGRLKEPGWRGFVQEYLLRSLWVILAHAR